MLTLSVPAPPAGLVVTLLLGSALLAGAVLFDRATGARRRPAASLVIATAAAFVGAYAFPGIGSPGQFRQARRRRRGRRWSADRSVVVAWSTRGRFARERVLSARAR